MATKAEIAHTQLWLGNPAYVREQVCRYIADTSGYSHTCISDEQQPYVIWIKPESVYYKRSDLTPLFQKTALHAAANEQWFIVITAADRLTNSTANSLLKILEEPPAGYVFILCAHYQDWVLPTIYSRSVVYHVTSDAHESHPLVDCCYEYETTTFAQFAKFIREQVPNEYETRSAVDALLTRWCQQRESVAHDYKLCRDIDVTIQIIIAYADLLPVSGSAKYFWRSLFSALKTRSAPHVK